MSDTQLRSCWFDVSENPRNSLYHMILLSACLFGFSSARLLFLPWLFLLFNQCKPLVSMRLFKPVLWCLYIVLLSSVFIAGFLFFFSTISIMMLHGYDLFTQMHNLTKPLTLTSTSTSRIPYHHVDEQPDRDNYFDALLFFSFFLLPSTWQLILVKSAASVT